MPNPESLRDIARKWRSTRAHTYASENADHYRGFDAGQLRAADELDAWIDQAEAQIRQEAWGYNMPRVPTNIITELFGKKEE